MKDASTLFARSKGEARTASGMNLEKEDSHGKRQKSAQVADR